MKTRKDIFQQAVFSEKGKRVLTIIFILAAALLLYFFWGGAWLPRIENPGERFEDLEDFSSLKTDEETSRVLTPLQGLADAVKSLGEAVPDGDEESETIRRVKNFSKKVWEKIYEWLP